MKIRTGFVSNSSSSSFVVAFPHKPISVEDLKEMMFGKQEWHYISHHAEENGSRDISTQRIADAVFKDIEEKATDEEVYESIRNGWFDSYLFPDIFPGYYEDGKKTRHLDYLKDKEEIERIWKEDEKENDRRARNIAEAFIRGHDNKYIVVLTYSDEDGWFESILEHTDIFNRIEHIITSYH